ncbi:MAG: hypothetical protein J6K80_06745 [Oscillospiraceae bacterium]|nr:hypothetical protein [Oscillospiraceae bacterium]
MAVHDKPLLLVDDNNILSIINEGEFKCYNLTFDEVHAMLDTYPEDAVAKCFSSFELEEIVFDYIGAERKNYLQLCMTNLQVDQYAIAFKLYRTPSETQPEVLTINGAHAKKIQNVYVYCQLITRTK